MRLEIDTDEGDCTVDRDGALNGLSGTNSQQGFGIVFGSLTIHFQCESDAVMMAKKILYRMGELPVEKRP